MQIMLCSKLRCQKSFKIETHFIWNPQAQRSKPRCGSQSSASTTATGATWHLALSFSLSLSLSPPLSLSLSHTNTHTYTHTLSLSLSLLSVSHCLTRTHLVLLLDDRGHAECSGFRRLQNAGKDPAPICQSRQNDEGGRWVNSWV